jgi:hypothetical protein
MIRSQDCIYFTDLGDDFPVANDFWMWGRRSTGSLRPNIVHRPLSVGDAERHDVDDFLQLNGYSSVNMEGFVGKGSASSTNSRLRRLSVVTKFSCACATAAFAGCVMQSTYDAAVQEGLTTRTELVQALEDQAALTRQVKDLEVANADVVREAEAAAAALREARDAADRERAQAEQRLAKLSQKVAQAGKQQRALQYEMTVAKENGAALQELIDVYQRKVREGAVASTAESAVHKPFDPSSIPVPQDLPPAPAVTPPQPAPPPTPEPAARAAKSPSPPADEGWFSSIKSWLVSLWRSVFS